jgi:hypothetical protein
MQNDDQSGQAALDSFLDMWVTGTTAGRRAPVLRRPGEVGLDFEEVTFPSMDGVALEGWFIPAKSDKLIIHNHFLRGDRMGIQAICRSSAAWADSRSTSCPSTRRCTTPATTRPEDVQSIYDAIPGEQKKLVWIEGTTRRFDGYNYFGEHPEVPIDWFNAHTG